MNKQWGLNSKKIFFNFLLKIKSKSYFKIKNKN